MIRKQKLELLKKYKEQLKVVSKQELDNNPKGFLKIRSSIFTLNDGKKLVREKIVKGGGSGSAAIIVPILKNGEVLTIVEPRVYTKETVGIGFPSGYIEKGEDPIVGALRELKEETGYVSNNVFEIDDGYQDEGCSEALNRFFIALDCYKKYDQCLDGDEIVKYMTFTIDELEELKDEKYIRGIQNKYVLMLTKDYMKGR